MSFEKTQNLFGEISLSKLLVLISIGIIIAILGTYMYTYMYDNKSIFQRTTDGGISVPPRTTDFLEFDTELSTPDLNTKYIKYGNLKDIEHIVPVNNDIQYLICRDNQTKNKGIWNQETGCMTATGRSNDYGIIDSNYQYTWVPTRPKLLFDNICSIDTICLRPITQEFNQVNKFVYNDGFIRPIGSTSLCLSTDKRNMRYIFLASSLDTNVYNKWDCNQGNTEIVLRAYTFKRIAYEISDNEKFSRLFLSDQETNVNTNWFWDFQNNLFTVGDKAMSLYKVSGTVGTTNNNTTVCQIASEYNDMVAVENNILYLKREFTNSATHLSALNNNYKGKTIVDGAPDKYTLKTYPQILLPNVYCLFVSSLGFLQVNESTNTLVFNSSGSEQYKWLFRFEDVSKGDKYTGYQVKIYVRSVGRTPVIEGLLTCNTSKNNFIVDFQKNRQEDDYIFRVKYESTQKLFYRTAMGNSYPSIHVIREQTDYDMPFFYPKYTTNRIDLKISCISGINSPDDFMFPFDMYENCYNVWSNRLPRTFQSITSISDVSIPFNYMFPVYVYKGRYLKDFESNNYVPVGFRGGNLVISPTGTDPWGLYGLPTNLSNISNWGLSTPRYSIGIAFSDEANNCIWVVNEENMSLESLSSEQLNRIIESPIGTTIDIGSDTIALLQSVYLRHITGTDSGSYIESQEINKLANRPFKVYKISYISGEIAVSEDNLLWVKSPTQLYSATCVEKTLKMYQFTKVVNGITVIDTSRPPQPYLLQRVFRITYGNSIIEVPLGIRYKAIGAYNDNSIYNYSRYRDFYDRNNPNIPGQIIPNIQILSLIIKNELQTLSIIASDDAIEWLAIRWFRAMDVGTDSIVKNEDSRYNLNTLKNWLTGIRNINGKNNWTIYDVINSQYDPDIVFGYRS